MAASPHGAPEPGSLLIDLLTLTGWQIDTAQGDRVEATAQRLYDGQLLTAKASGSSLADVALELFERACEAAWNARRRGDAQLAA
jgi:hypothetical protein